MRILKRICLICLVALTTVSCTSYNSLMKKGKYDEAYSLAKKTNKEKNVIEYLMSEGKYNEAYKLADVDHNNGLKKYIIDNIIIDKQYFTGYMLLKGELNYRDKKLKCIEEIVKISNEERKKLSLLLDWKMDGNTFVQELIKNNDLFFNIPRSLVLSEVDNVAQVKEVCVYDFLQNYIFVGIMSYLAQFNKFERKKAIENIAWIGLCYNTSNKGNDWLDYTYEREQIDKYLLLTFQDRLDTAPLVIVTKDNNYYQLNALSLRQHGKNLDNYLEQIYNKGRLSFNAIDTTSFYISIYGTSFYYTSLNSYIDTYHLCGTMMKKLINYIEEHL